MTEACFAIDIVYSPDRKVKYHQLPIHQNHSDDLVQVEQEDDDEHELLPGSAALVYNQACLRASLPSLQLATITRRRISHAPPVFFSCQASEHCNKVIKQTLKDMDRFGLD